jgi:hypothetical protein
MRRPARAAERDRQASLSNHDRLFRWILPARRATDVVVDPVAVAPLDCGLLCFFTRAHSTA